MPAMLVGERKSAAPVRGPKRVPPAAVREQLDRLLSHSLFRHSKRYPALLRHVTEHALTENDIPLSERCLGVEAFGRNPDYDTDADPVVRVTVSEIRKRLTQYYADPAHAGELRILLPLGSYLPEFSSPGSLADVVDLPGQKSRLVSALAGHRIHLATALALVLATAVAWWWQPFRSGRPSERFWEPVVKTSGAVIICVGQLYGSVYAADNEHVLWRSRAGGAPRPIPAEQFDYFLAHNVSIDDAMFAQKLGGLLGGRGKETVLRGMETTSLADVRGHATVFIGDPFHDWVSRILAQTRYYVERDHGRIRVRDRQNPAKLDWEMQPGRGTSEKDYGIVVRMFEPSTGQQVVLATGAYATGTAAASDVLNTPGYLDAALAGAPRGWERKNLQLVFDTKVVKDTQGVPKLIALYCW